LWLENEPKLLFKLKYTQPKELDLDCLEGTFFRSEFCKNFDEIMGIDKAKMINSQDRVEKPYINELKQTQADHLAYEKRCFKAYEDSAPGWCKALCKKAKQKSSAAFASVKNVYKGFFD
jgi:hypothetical protein